MDFGDYESSEGRGCVQKLIFQLRQEKRKKRDFTKGCVLNND